MGLITTAALDINATDIKRMPDFINVATKADLNTRATDIKKYPIIVAVLLLLLNFMD